MTIVLSNKGRRKQNQYSRHITWNISQKSRKSTLRNLWEVNKIQAVYNRCISAISVKLQGKKSIKLSNCCIISLFGIDQCRNQQVSTLCIHVSFVFLTNSFRMSWRIAKDKTQFSRTRKTLGLVIQHFSLSRRSHGMQ